MSRAEQWYIHSLLEPDDIVRAGNTKRFKPVAKSYPLPKNNYPVISEYERNRREDEIINNHIKKFYETK